MKILYLDCFSGISGDMLLGALADATGLCEEVTAALSSLPMAEEFSLSFEKTCKNGISGTDAKVGVHSCHHHGGHEHHHEHRGLSDVYGIIEASGISHSAKVCAKDIFLRVAEAEARVHGTDVESIHFHEVGAVDSIVDIVGTAVLLDLIAPDAIICSPVNVGSGTVKCAHGVLPVPAPATAELLYGMSVYSRGEGELATPTGAAVLATLARQEELPEMRLAACGYGFGKRDTGSLNALRVLIGESEEGLSDTVTLIEANLDDMTGEALGYASELLRDMGALDVWLTPIYMKKNRPAYMLSVLAENTAADGLAEAVLRETTTLGVRISAVRRKKLLREERTVTVAGKLAAAIKFARGYGVEKHKIEYEDLKRYARESGQSIEDARRKIEEGL